MKNILSLIENRSLFLGLLSLVPLLATAQVCPDKSQSSATIVVTPEQCFNDDNGQIQIDFVDASGVYNASLGDFTPGTGDYEYNLFDSGDGWVYSESGFTAFNIPGISVTYTAPNRITFTGLPPITDGSGYIIYLSGGSCTVPAEDYTTGAFNIVVSEATEVIIDNTTIATTGNDQCAAPFTGEIDATGAVSGGAGGYEYSINGGINYLASPVFSNIEHGTYTLTVRDANGCIVEETGIVVNDDRVSPTANISPNPVSVCVSEDITLNGNPAGGAGGFVHQWTGDISVLSATNLADPTFNASADGTYSLTYTVTDANGCTAISSINVTVNALPTVTDQTPEVCADVPGGTQATAVNLTAQNTAIDGGSGFTINWFEDVALNTAVADPANATVNDGDDFFAEVTDGNGCAAVATVTYTVSSAPLAPTNLATANIVCDGFDLSWDASAGAVDYLVEVDEDPAFGSPEINTTQAVTSINVSGLSLGTNYNIRIIPINSCGDGIAATSSETTSDIPAALANLATANPVCDGFDLSWDASAEADDYLIEIDDASDFSSVDVSATQAGTTYTASGLANGTTYYYRVTPKNSCGDGTASTGDETTTDVPAALANLVSANPVCDGFDLSWDASAGAVDYLVEVDEDPAFGSPEVNTSQAGTTYIASGLANGTTYYYRVTPRNACGDGAAATGDETTTDVPVALANLATANPVCDGFDLSWDASAGAVDYLIEIDDASDFSSVDVSATQAGTTYTASGLANGTTYYYRVTPRNACGDGTAATGDETTTGVPAALTNLATANPVCDGFDLSWDASTGAVDYLIEIDDASDFSSVDVSATQAGTTYTASGLANGTTYYYRVTPKNSCGDGTASTGDETTTDVPAALANLVSANPVCDGFDLSWDASAGAVDYLVEVDEDPAFGSPEVNTSQAGTTYIASGLANGTTYYYRVTPRNACGDGAAATGDETTTDVPVALANLVSANPVCDGFDLSWDASAGAVDYLIEIDDASDFSSVDVSATQAGTTYTASGLANGTTYYYRVTPRNACGDGTAASGDETTTDVPAAIANLASANPVCDGFDLSWDASAGAVDYLIEVDEDPAFGSPEVNTSQAGTTYTASGLANGTTYYYRVTPRNACGDGAAATGDDTTTGVPAALTNLATANPVCDGFDLSWDASAGAVDYLIEIDDASDFSSVDVSVTQAGTTYTASGLVNGTTYYYRVTPRNACGDGTAASGDETTTDAPTAPVNLLNSGENCESFTADWDAVVGASSYVLEVSEDGFATLSASATPAVNTATTTGLSAGVTYEWRVAAVNGCGNSAWSAPQSVATDALPPVTDQTPVLCSDVAGGSTASGVDLTALEASVDGGAGLPFTWYEDAGLTAAVADPTNVTVNDGEDFYAEVGSGSCTSIASVSYTVNPLDDATFSYAGAPYCQFSSNETPTITGDAGTFTSTAGLVFADAMTGEIDLSSSTPGTYTITYTTSGTCLAVGTQVITINAASDPSFSYASGTFCQTAGLQLPTVNETGGTFSAGIGLVIDAGTGEIDPAASTVGGYTVTYAFGGACPSSATFDVSITTAPDATFSYSGSPYCPTDADPSPAYGVGASAGSFTASPAGLSINSSTGAIDLSVSTPGTYTVTNTIAAVGSCAEASYDEVIEILTPDEATFSYSQTAYCQDEVNPIATIIGTLGGSFSSGAGLVIDTSTGEIDLTASTQGSYTVTYTTSGACPASSDVSVTINAVDDATFTYASLAYCRNEINPAATITGTGGGTFSSGTGAVFVNQFTGEIDLTATPVGNHDITYTTPGSCPATSTVSLDIYDAPGATDQTLVVCEDVSGSGTAIFDLTSLESAVNGGVGLTFSWYADAALTSAVADPTNVNVSNADIYYVQVDDGNCQSVGQATFTVNSLPVLIDQAPAVCEDAAGSGATTVDLTSLEAAIDGGNGLIFTWYQDAGLTTAVADPVNVSVNDSDDFFASVSDGSCSDVASVTYTVNNLPTVSFTGLASPYCETDAAILLTGNQAPGGTFSGPGITDNGDGTATFDPAIAGQGTFSLNYSFTDGNGCTNQSSQSVIVNDCTLPSSPNFIADVTSICDGDVVTFTDQSSGTITTYTWDFGAGATPTTATGPGPHAVTYTGVGSYTVSLTVDGPTTETKADYITVNSADDSGFAYSTTDYCPSGPNQLPVSINTAGGTFSALPAGLIVDVATGEINIAASTAGSYTVTYTTAGSCPTSSDVLVNINAEDDPSFTYGSATYCQSDPNPSATITGDSGAFTAPAGLVLANAATGEIDLASSTPGNYTITYTTSGICPASATFDVTIEAAPDAAFSFASASYCLTAGNQLPTVNQAGGIFTCTGPAGFLIDAATGEIDPSAGTAGDTYTVTYTINGVACNDSFNFDVSITGTPDATFNHSQLSYCQTDTDPAPVLGAGASVGVFSASSSDLIIDPATGVIDLDASLPGTYTITNTIAAVGSCSADVHNELVEILASDDASFSYATTDFCLSDTNPVATISGLAGGSFTSSNPANLVVDATSGEIDLAASTAGAYDVIYTTSGTCPQSTTVSVNLYEVEDASFSYAATDFCLSDANPVATISGLAGGSFTSSDPANLVVDAGSGEIDLAASTAGTYDVTYTTPGTSPGGCVSSSTLSIILNSAVTADASTDGLSCNYDYTFAAAIPVSGTGTWTMISTPSGSETSFITNPNDPNSDVQVSASGTYQFQWEVTNGGCTDTDIVEVIFSDELDIIPLSTNPAFNCSIWTAWNVSIAGGSGSYSQVWMPTGETDLWLDNDDFSGVPGGVYRLDVTDDVTGCSTYDVYAIANNQIDGNLTTTAIDNSCSGSSDGEIHVEYINDYNVTIYDEGRNVIHTASRLGGDTEILTGLAASTYFVEVEDAGLGCVTAREVLITEPAPVTLTSVAVNDLSCPGANDGSITMDVSGGITPLSFSWKDASDTEVSTNEDPTGLTAGDYYIDITYGGGCSFTSTVYTISEPAPSTGPVANTATSVSCNAFTISWSDESVTNYEVQVATDNTFTNLVTGLDPYLINDGSTSLTVNTGISAATSYYYRVRAEDGCGWSEYSNVESASTDPVTAPVAQNPSGVVCDQFTANWNDVTGANKYFIDVATSSSFDAADILPAYDDLDAGLVSTYNITGLTPGITYYYRVRVETTCGISASSNTEEATLVDVPTAPVNLLNSGENCESFTADWDAVVGASSYVLEVSEDGFATLAASATPAVNTATTTGLSAGVTYEWRVAAVNGCGNSAWSAPQSVATDALPPVTDQTPVLCSDVAGGSTASGVDLTALEASVDGGAGLPFTWYEDAGLTAAVADPTNVTVNDGEDFYAEVGSGSCTSIASVSYTVNPLDDATFSYAGAPYCQFSSNETPTITGDAGTFTSTAGLVFADAMTGEIDLSSSTPGTYTITYTTSGTCLAVGTQVITINAASDPSFSYASGTFCQTAGLQLPTVNETGGTFSAGIGLVIDAGTGEIDPAASTVGGYTVTYAFGGACPSSATFNVTITDQLAAPTGILASTPSCSGFSTTWDAVSGAVSYRVEASSDNFATIAESATVTDLTYEFTSLSVSTFDYEIRVTAIDDCGADGLTSAEESAQTASASACGCGFDQASFVVSSENANCPASEDGALMVYVDPITTTKLSRFEYRYVSVQDSINWTAGGNFPGLVFLADSLSPGNYTVMIRDTNAQTGCDTLMAYSRTVAVQNAVTVTASPESCEGNDGSITVNLESSCTSTQAYEIIGINMDTMEPVLFTGTTATSLSAGSYRIALRDDLGNLLDTLAANVISTCNSNGGGGSGITCSLGDKTVDVDITPADCERGEGSVTFSVIGGENDTYNFRIVSLSGVVDETKTATGVATFNNLPAGAYDYIVVDEAGTPRCESAFNIVENIVVINTIGFDLPACDAPAQVATMSVTLSAATNAPAPYNVYVIQGTDTVSTGLIEAGTTSTDVPGVPTGSDYNIVVHSRGTQSCPATRMVNIPSTGVVDIGFEYEAENITCFGDGGKVTVRNIVVAENTEFTINLMSVNQTQPYMSRIFSAIPSRYTFSDLESGDYQVQIIQQQASCGIIRTESSPTFTVEGPTAALIAAVPETVHVTVNEPYGNILVDSISGGGQPYEVRIAADPFGNTGDWYEVPNDNPAIDPYAYEFRDLEMGTYFIELRDAFGCTSLHEVNIRYTAELYIPNIITPNGDGDNDTFRIINLEEIAGERGGRMVISNRWGRIVHQADSYTNDNAWDGGNSADGMYFYDLLLPDGSRHTGWIEIWRGRTP